MENYNRLLEILEKRFLENTKRHRDIFWADILDKISNNEAILKALNYMEESGGQPDVFYIDNHIYYIDSSVESPKDRRSLCYDKKSRVERKKLPPISSVEEELEKYGLELVDENLYFALQNFSDFDTKTSSWLKTSEDIRKKGGAIFGDKRYGRTFIYHNGADSYYSSRGFRAYIKL